MISRHRRLRVGIATLATAIVFSQSTAFAGTLDESTDAKNPGIAIGSVIPHAFAAGSQSNKETFIQKQVNIYGAFALIQGHLLIGDELVKRRHWSHALPHFDALMKEWEELAKKSAGLPDISELRDELPGLVEAVKTKDDSYEQRADTTQKKLTALLNRFRDTLPAPVAKIAVKAVNSVLRIAATTYAASIDNGQFVNPTQYQYSRGLVWSAELIYVDHSLELETANLRSLGQIRMLMNVLKAALPTAIPPKAPIARSEDLAATIVQIEQLSTVYQ